MSPRESRSGVAIQAHSPHGWPPWKVGHGTGCHSAVATHDHAALPAHPGEVIMQNWPKPDRCWDLSTVRHLPFFSCSRNGDLKAWQDHGSLPLPAIILRNSIMVKLDRCADVAAICRISLVHAWLWSCDHLTVSFRVKSCSADPELLPWLDIGGFAPLPFVICFLICILKESKKR